MKKKNYTIAIVAAAAGIGSASGDGLADDFSLGNNTGIRTDEIFFSNQPGYRDQDPGNFGDKEGFPVERPGGSIRGYGQIGYDSNPWEQDDGYENAAMLYRLGVRGANLWGTSKGSAYLGGGISATYYDFEDPAFSRDGSDDMILDLTLRAGLTYNVSESVKFVNWSSLDYGGTGQYNQGFVRPGVLWQNVLRVQSDSRLDYRFDGQAQGINGTEFSTAINYLGFYGADQDNEDFTRLGVTQTFDRVINPDLRVGLVTRWACDYYDYLDMYDSESMDLGIAASGRCRYGFDYVFESGVQWRSYDAGSAYDRDMWYCRGVMNGEVRNNVFLSTRFSYGVEDTYSNFGVNFREPNVLRAEARLTADLGEYEVRGQLGAGRFESDLMGGPTDEITRYTAGFGVDRDLGDLRVGASLEYIWGDRDVGAGFDYDRTQFVLSLQRSF